MASASSKRHPHEHLVVHEDLSTGRFFLINNDTGDRLSCLADGTLIRKMIPGVSGVVKTNVRKKLGYKDAAWNAYVAKPAPPRPPPLAADHLSRADRVVTKDRFGVKLPREVELALREQRRLRALMPEREEAARAKEEAFRLKIEEQHRNSAALARSPGSPMPNSPAQDKAARPELKVVRAEKLAFTSTGVFRP